MALCLRGVASGFWTACQENQLPAALLHKLAQPRQNTRLDLLERFPEIHATAHGFPQLPLLTAAEGIVSGFGLIRWRWIARVWCRRAVRRRRAGQAGRVDAGE